MTAYDLNVSVTNYGASLQDVRLSGNPLPLVLGFSAPDDYASHSAHMGATAGVYANRIAAGQFTIDDVTYQLDRNENNRTTLHGGRQGTGTQIWDLIEADEEKAVFALTQPDGFMGFPGKIDLRCTYQITAKGTLAISYHATTSKPTFVNLAHHSYFRLDDAPDISGHELQVFADRYLETDDDNLPHDGAPVWVAGTAYDFRSQTKIGNHNIDHNFCLDTKISAKSSAHSSAQQFAGAELRPVARLYSPLSSLSLQVSSDQPGLQIYTAHHLCEAAPNHHGRPYRAFDGICLEPQNWPNSPNRDDFPSSLLRPDEAYHQRLELYFCDESVNQ